MLCEWEGNFKVESQVQSVGCQLEKEMATHSCVLAWRTPGTGEPGGLPSMGSQSRTRLKRLSSSSGATAQLFHRLYRPINVYKHQHYILVIKA